MAIDFLALGEISEADAERLRSRCQASRFLQLRKGSVRGIVVMYRADRVELRQETFLTSSQLGRELRRSIHFELGVSDPPVLVHMFVLHWPSDARGNAGPQQRATLARDLRESIKKLPPAALAVVLGDFNAEPFHSVFSRDLAASRERSLARKKSLLYNPCWRLLGEQQSLQQEARDAQRRGPGTYLYRSSGTTTQWYTMDQILVSAALLDTASWHLDEDSVTIWQQPPLLNVENGRLRLDFDHFPIVGSLCGPT